MLRATIRQQAAAIDASIRVFGVITILSNFYLAFAGMSLAHVAIGRPNSGPDGARTHIRLCWFAAESLSDLGDCAVSGKRGALLPSDQMGDVVASHVDDAVGFDQAGIAGKSRFLAEVRDPRTEVVGNGAPRNVNRIGKFL